MTHTRRGLLTFLALFCIVSQGWAADEKTETITLADGKFEMTAPKSWKRQQPRTQIVEHEFSAPAVEGDKIDGRLTVMGAGGSIEANIDRWVGQFKNPSGKAVDKKTDKQSVADAEVHIVDLSGTYADSAGPFAPAVSRDNYRMLAAIVATKGSGNYFLKFYGPAKTVTENEKAFRDMVKSLRAK